jgi:hypothetical protein
MKTRSNVRAGLTSRESKCETAYTKCGDGCYTSFGSDRYPLSGNPMPGRLCMNKCARTRGSCYGAIAIARANGQNV